MPYPRKAARNELWLRLHEVEKLSFAEIGRQFNESRQLVWSVIQREKRRRGSGSGNGAETETSGKEGRG